VTTRLLRRPGKNSDHCQPHSNDHNKSDDRSNPIAQAPCFGLQTLLPMTDFGFASRHRTSGQRNSCGVPIQVVSRILGRLTRKSSDSRHRSLCTRPANSRQALSLLSWDLAAATVANADTQSRERDVRDRIATLMRASREAPQKEITAEEVEELRTASARLDKLLADAAADEEARRKEIREEEVKKLRAALGRLDQLLADASGKEGVIELKQRRRKT
jgi:hypothetical protein